jgi:hypothetical protein
MGAFEGSARLVGEIIGFAIAALLFVVCALPIYFVLKKISGSKTTFTEDLREYVRWQPQPRPETSRMLSTLDSVESIFLEIYKYVLILALILGSVFIVWFFINVHNDAERSFLRLYFGGAYLFLVFCVVGNLVAIKWRQARTSLAGMTQTASPVPEPAIRASVDPPLPAGVKTAPSQDARPAQSALTLQEIVVIIMVFVFAVGTFSVVLLMLRGFPRLPF